MPDPTINNNDTGLFGIKAASVVAGFAGGVVSLSFIRGLTVIQSVLAVVTGAVSAGYLTPGVVYYLDLPVFLENFAGFIIGLTAMNVIPGVVKITELFKKDPARVVGNLTGLDAVSVAGKVLDLFKRKKPTQQNVDGGEK